MAVRDSLDSASYARDMAITQQIAHTILREKEKDTENMETQKEKESITLRANATYADNMVIGRQNALTAEKAKVKEKGHTVSNMEEVIKIICWPILISGKTHHQQGHFPYST